MNEAKLPPLPPYIYGRECSENERVWPESLVREYGALCARQATESIADALSDALQSDLENGVKWLNERASERFTADYPELRKAIAAILAQPQTGGNADE
jgi:hypothetical protein